jgi:hypothetical protein
MKKSLVLAALTAMTMIGFSALPVKADPIIVRTGTNAQVFSNSAGWTTLPGTSFSLVLNQGKLVTTRFSAESACYGASGWCAARVVYRRLPGGPITELNPVVDTDFAFDSTNNNGETFGSWESHAINRSVRLTPGRYQFFIQVRPVQSGIDFRIDDWSFELELT